MRAKNYSERQNWRHRFRGQHEWYICVMLIDVKLQYLTCSAPRASLVALYVDDADLKIYRVIQTRLYQSV